MVRGHPNRRDRRPRENGGPKNKRARRSTSDQEEESNSEDEEREEGMVNEKTNKKTNGQLEVAATIKQEEDMSEPEDQIKSKDAGKKGTGLTNGVKHEDGDKRNEDRCHLNGDVKEEEVETEQSGTKPYIELSKPYTETPTQTFAQTEQVSVTMTTETGKDAEQKPNVQSESAQPAADVPPPQPVKRKC